LNSFDQTMILPDILSDHSPIMADFERNWFVERSIWWRFNISLLQNNQFNEDFKASLSEFLSFNIGSVEDPIFVWEATKGFIKDFSIAFATNVKKMQNQRIDHLDSFAKGRTEWPSEKESRICDSQNQTDLLLHWC